MTAIPARLIAMLVGALLIVGVLIFGVTQCEKRRNIASQAAVERSQAQAARDSAEDAIGTVEDAGARETASEALTRENEQAIRSANGADAAVDPAVRDAGLASLCKRSAYANDPRCRRP